MRRLIVVLLTVAACVASWRALTFAETAAPATLGAGENAYIALHFDEARAIYAAAAASPTQTPKERAASWRQLGIMAWRLKGNPSEAENDFRRALAVNADVSATNAELARFYASVHRFDEAIRAADAAIATAQTTAERKAAFLAVAKGVLTKLDGIAIEQQTVADLEALRHARDVMRPLSAEPPLPLEHSEALLEISLRLDDGTLALAAWNSYAREGAEAGQWAPAARRLAASLPHWRKGEISPALRGEVFEGLRASQFFDLATLVANDARLSDAADFVRTPRVAEVAAYAQMLRQARDATDGYYRDIANKRADHAAWRKALGVLGQTVWSKLDFPSAPPVFSEEALARELRARFGTVINIGDTGGVEDMHYGHVFLDDKRSVEQYGHRAELRLIALDRMVSNGYESWVWDGRQAHGGWANEEGIHQVRSQYADGALNSWDRMTDPAQRAEIEAKIAHFSAGDDEIAKRDVTAFLPGLALRLRWSGQNALLDDLRKAGPNGPELKRRFVLDMNRITLDSSIFAHEGRHALDQLFVPTKLVDEELEFDAKLSEVAFSERPRLCFGSIINPTIADATSPHGRANKRIMQGLVAWMTAHRDAIAGLDPTRPLLPQLDKLSDDQLRTAMRAMDSWAPKP